MQSALQHSARALGAWPTTEDRSAIPAAPHSTRSEVAAAVAAPSTPVRSGPSTIAGLEHRGLQTAPTRPRHWSRLSFIGVAVALLAAFAWAIAVRRMGGSEGTADHAATQAHTGTGAASETAAMDKTIRLPPESEPSVVTAEPTPPPSVARTANTANANGAPAPRAPHAAAPAVRTTTTSVASAAGNAESSPREKPNCNPPYTIDLVGRRIPKPECL
jgi:hypothetical protein